MHISASFEFLLILDNSSLSLCGFSQSPSMRHEEWGVRKIVYLLPGGIPDQQFDRLVWTFGNGDGLGEEFTTDG